MNKIAIIAALPGELKPLVRGWEPCGKNLWTGRIGDWETIAIAGGIGAASAERAVERASAEMNADILVSYGWAGALTCAVKPRSACAISEIIDAATGERFVTDYPNGYRLITLDRVARVDEKRALAAKHQAVLVDMEAAAVARIAAARNIPFYCFKAVSDGYTDRLPDFGLFINSKGELRMAALLAYVALRPRYWSSLQRLGKNSSVGALALVSIVQEGAQTMPMTESSNSLRWGRMTADSIPATMQAAVYRGVNDVRVETVPVPEIGAGEVLIRVAACGICGTDLKKIHTGSHAAPRIFGHETAGTIAAVGDGVRDFAVGDRVMVFHHIPCGQCFYCRKKTFAQCPVYKRVGCTAGFEPSGGGFAEYVRVTDWIVRRGLVKIADGVPFAQAAFVEPVNTCFKAIRNLALTADETVLVIGQGPIGILLAALAVRTGARVLTSDLFPERHKVAAAYGLTRPIDAGRQDVVGLTHAASEGRGADAVILAVGGNTLIKTAMDAARPGGRVLLFAQTQHGDAVIDPAAVCMDEKSLIGSYSSSEEIQDEAAQLVFDGYKNGFDLTRLISHRFALGDAVKAIHMASNPGPGSMKIFIEPELSQV